MSAKLRLNKEDGKKILKVVVYASLAAGCSALIELIPQIDVPGGYLVLIPIVNTVLVALKKLFTADQS